MKAWQILLLLGGAAYLYSKKSNSQTLLPKFQSNPSSIESDLMEDESDDEMKISNDGFEEDAKDIEEDSIPAWNDEDDDSVVVTEADDEY